jgi:isocitrate dehydrogenase kinase/phosphatase
VRVDAVLLAEHEVSIVFSYTHSYFLVATERPGALVRFLRALMPQKPVDELYNSIGYNKHGKTELYRALLRHLEPGRERFDFAPGARGMVMIVFTMPSFDVVFKVIRDHFQPPKTGTRRQVMEKYQLVFQHDRAGRLIDAQEFEHLQFARDRFAPELLAELCTQAAGTVEVVGDTVVIHHLYTERRVTPLDIYLRGARSADAAAAVHDYGAALRDLAATNIFPGDLLLKNFGVTRQRRVVFYDYDELCLLTDCNFRYLPPARSDDEEWAGEPWFYAGERDIFPEEFRSFLGLDGALLRVFLDAHGDLLEPAYWRRTQERIRCGEIMDVLPYRAERRFQRD